MQNTQDTNKRDTAIWTTPSEILAGLGNRADEFIRSRRNICLHLRSGRIMNGRLFAFRGRSHTLDIYALGCTRHETFKISDITKITVPDKPFGSTILGKEAPHVRSDWM